MKTGLPRQATVRRWPTCTGARSTSVVDNASVSRAGFRLSTNGQTDTTAPTPASAPAVRIRKSRRVPPSWPVVTCDCARSAIQLPRQSAAAVAQPPPRPQAIPLKGPNYATDCRIKRQRRRTNARSLYCAEKPSQPIRNKRFAPRSVRTRYPAEYRGAAAPGGLFRDRGRSDRAVRFRVRRPAVEEGLARLCRTPAGSSPFLGGRLPRGGRSGLAAGAADHRPPGLAPRIS